MFTFLLSQHKPKMQILHFLNQPWFEQSTPGFRTLFFQRSVIKKLPTHFYTDRQPYLCTTSCAA